MLRSVVVQLFEHSPRLYAIFLRDLEPPDALQKASLEVLLKLLKQAVDALEQCYIVLDALDECSERRDLRSIFEELVSWKAKQLHLFIASRHEHDIRCTLQDFMNDTDMIKVENAMVDKDIHTWVRHLLQTDQDFQRWRSKQEVREEIENKVVGGSKGMFRWAECQLRIMKKCLTKKMIREALAKMPNDLDATYDQILRRIDEDHLESAKRILTWLVYAGTPMPVTEIAEIAAIDITRTPAFDPGEVLEDPMDALGACSSLITTAKTLTGQPVFILSHYTVQELLLREETRIGKLDIKSSGQILAESCVRYLLEY
ncbi:hypothetical protein K402DRAFT_369786, partial [Aulographum hederae CBS 113979]